MDPVPALVGPELPRGVTALPHEGHEVAVADRHYIDPERLDLETLYWPLLGPGRQLGIRSHLHFPSGKARHDPRIRQAPSPGQRSLLRRSVELTEALKRLQDRLAAAVLVLQDPAIALGGGGPLIQIDLLQLLQHPLAHVGHAVEPGVVGFGSQGLLVRLVQQELLLESNDSIELGENGAYFESGLEDERLIIQRADQQDRAGACLGKQLGESAAGGGDGTNSKHATFGDGAYAMKCARVVVAAPTGYILRFAQDE